MSTSPFYNDDAVEEEEAMGHKHAGEGDAEGGQGDYQGASQYQVGT